MSGEALTLIGVTIAALIAFGGAVINAVSSRATASAAEVTALSGSTKELRDRLDQVERELRGLRAYIADDHDDHRRNDWPIRPLPDELR